MQTLIDNVARLCREAGRLIVDIYQDAGAVDVYYKADESPLTQADLQANACLVKGLATLLPNTPILSEELELPPLAERHQWQEYWLVDPLDGTKEFIHRTGDFTVNVALIRQGKPVLGVVYAPLSDVLYGAINQVEECHAYKEDHNGRHAIKTRKALANNEPLTVVTSRRHGLDALSGLMAKLNKLTHVGQPVAVGSSLKLCWVAEGIADLYPRFGLTSQWDTAAAQAVVEAAGGHVVDLQWQPFHYEQKESVLNPEFYVIGDSIDKWRQLLDA